MGNGGSFFQKALLIVDFQNDFCSGGALAVKGAETIVESLNNYIDVFCQHKLPIFASRDWHTPVSRHFKQFGGEWPVHCVQNTKGAQFYPGLKLPEKTIILSKGMDPDLDSYSAFDGFDKNSKLFAKVLEDLDIKELYVGGLATDYCVKASVIDALDKGYKANLLIDAVKGVDVKPGDSQNAVKEMLARGAVIIKDSTHLF